LVGQEVDVMEMTAVGWVESTLTDVVGAPPQGDEGAPEATIRFAPEVAEATRDLRVGDELVVLTWLHMADRDVLAVHPRGDAARPLTGVFSTRSPHRPNPIGLHEVAVRAIDGLRVRVSGLEAIDGTPVIDIKPVLRDLPQR
jgi:tRNA-Thr(GGU) m(6)t(6)A37 methyltransferase TsaA